MAVIGRGVGPAEWRARAEIARVDEQLYGVYLAGFAANDDRLTDAVHDVAHAIAGRVTALARQPGRMRQYRLAHRPLGIAHVRRVAAPALAAADPARTAPAGHRHGLINGAGLDSSRRDTVQRHARLLASRWIRHPSDYQEPLSSQQRHAARATRRSRNVKTYGLCPVFKQALRSPQRCR
jgi:hypothetical protein